MNNPSVSGLVLCFFDLQVSLKVFIGAMHPES
jgi:hypothetical protein